MWQTPWGDGKWGAREDGGKGSSLFMNFVGSEHDIVLGKCNTFDSKRRADGEAVKGWMQIPLVAQQGCFAKAG